MAKINRKLEVNLGRLHGMPSSSKTNKTKQTKIKYDLDYTK